MINGVARFFSSIKAIMSSDPNSYTISATEANIYLRGAAANPLVNFAPDIDWEYNVKVKKDGTVTVTGKHDGFPCHEIGIIKASPSQDWLLYGKIKLI